MDIKRIKSRGKMANGEPNPIDVYVGKRMRLRRQMLCLSQEKLAAALWLNFSASAKIRTRLKPHGRQPFVGYCLGFECSDKLLL